MKTRGVKFVRGMSWYLVRLSVVAIVVIVGIKVVIDARGLVLQSPQFRNPTMVVTTPSGMQVLTKYQSIQSWGHGAIKVRKLGSDEVIIIAGSFTITELELQP